MVENQIRTNKVTDPALLGALLELPREQFAPEALRALVYVDDDLAIGGGRYLTEPMVLARLVQLAEMKPSDAALVIGCGSGYAAAVIGRLCAAVVAIESDRALADAAAHTLAALGINNVAVHRTDLAGGYPPQAPYDAIVFDGAVAHVPETIVDQLAEGGRLVAVVADGEMGRGTLMIRRGGVVSRRAAFDAATPFLPGFGPAARFVF